MEILQREAAKMDEAVAKLKSENKNLLKTSAVVVTVNLQNVYLKLKWKPTKSEDHQDSTLSFVNSLGL